MVKRLREVLYTGWEKWLEEYGTKFIIGDGSNKTLHSVMATGDNAETDDRKVASNRQSGCSSSSEEESGNLDDGYDTERCGRRGCGNWKDMNSKQHEAPHPTAHIRLIFGSKNISCHEGILQGLNRNW